MNIIAWLEYELAYYDSAVHRFNHYTTRTPLFALFINAYKWCKNLTILPPEVGELKSRLCSLTIVRQLISEKENSEFKLAKLCIKIELVLHPPRAEGLVYIHIYIYIYIGRERERYIDIDTHTHTHKILCFKQGRSIFILWVLRVKKSWFYIWKKKKLFLC